MLNKGFSSKINGGPRTHVPVLKPLSGPGCASIRAETGRMKHF